MAKKISFNIDDVQLIEEKPDSSFSTLSLDFFASGTNKHDTFVSEETLFRTSETIKNVPLVWKYDSRLDDAYTHDPEEVPCGFVPENAEIKSRVLDDGRTMLSVISYVWKKYSGRILDFFKRDGDKPVSVEISVYDTEQMSGGLTELKDYRFEAVTILGTFVQPAIPLAKATVLQFSEAEEYRQALELEFGKYDEIDFKIPDEVKNNAEIGVNLSKKHGTGAPVSLSNAKYLLKNGKASPERIRQIYKALSSKKYKDIEETEPPTDEYITWMMYGGSNGFAWAKGVFEKLVEMDNKRISYFDTLDSQKDIQLEKEKEKMSVKKENELEEMAEQTPEEEKTETPEEEKKETPEEEKKEKEEGKEFSLDAYLDVAATLAFLQNETEVYEKVAAEFAKPYEEMDYATVMGAMYSHMCKMSDACKGMAAEKEEMSAKMSEMEEKFGAYMAENEELKKFKAEKETEEFNFAIDSVLKSIEEKKEIPQEELDSLKSEASNYSLETIDAWKNLAKSRAFEFAEKNKVEEGVKRYGLPFENQSRKIVNSPWSR